MQDIEDYKRTELLRKSVADVKVRADAQAQRRQSPSKTYSAVKSKIAGNMKSQKKAKKMVGTVEQNKAFEKEVLAGNYRVIDSLQGRDYPLSNVTVTQSKIQAVSPERQAAINQKASEINDLKATFNQRRADPSFLASTQQNGRTV